MSSYSDESKSEGISIKAGYILALVLAILHIGLAIWFASFTPYRQAGKLFIMKRAPIPDIGAPDERQHVNYVAHLLEGKGFPVFDPKDPNLGEDYQGHQPPVFYLLEAGWSKVVGVSEVTDPNSGVKLRALNCLLGGINVFLVFCLGCWGFRNVGIGLCAAAAAACLPMNVALSGAVSNDPLLFTLCTGALALCARSIQNGWTVKGAVLLGFVVGLAMLTKTTSLALAPAVLIAVLISPNRPSGKIWAAAIVPMIALPIGWWIRNQSLYGDPFAMKAFNEAFVGSAQAKDLIGVLGLPTYLLSWVGWWTIRSFFGAFGYMDIWLNESGLANDSSHNLLYRLLIIFALALFVGWVLSWKTRKDKATVAVQTMNLTFGVIVALLFLSFNMHYFQAQARYLYPAIGPIACAFGAGAVTLTKGKWPAALALLLIVFGGTTIYAGTRIPDAFAKRISG